MLSSRGARNAVLFDIPWRYAPPHTYDKKTNPSGLISFGMAEHLPMRREIADYINSKVIFTEDSVGYRGDPTHLPKAVAAHLNRILNPHVPIKPANIVVATSATALGGMLGFTLAESGDGILVSRPIYGRFELDYGVEAGVEIVYADTDPEEAFHPDYAVLKYEMALKEAEKRGVKIRAVIIVNPHNPVGRCYPAETLKEILRFCDRHHIHFISDEVYASCVFDSGDPEAVPFTSILSFDLSEFIDPDLVHLLYGFSKDFAAGGLHLGFLVSQNAQLLLACQATLRLHSPSTAAITIGTTILEDTEFTSQFIQKSQESLSRSYRLVTSVFDKEGIQYIKGGNAGFFIYINLSPYLPRNISVKDHDPQNGNNNNDNKSTGDVHREFALAQHLFDAGVFLHPNEEHAKEPGWFRLVFAHEEDTLQEGLKR
ncbi:hypothetical protein MPDQ_006903 [Monascus purpureus]|uniref:Aminotransferase class I/classII large domain-containing protein n=1 Tax=Monascus purpureus TaxID=5098 RepID=A0A507QXJ9_MONPU|nr:hypothetical protein MPDQ_006903 [Monascus purpureus]